MRFQVPQFIDIEDKVIGPFTFKQFIYIAGGAGTCFVLLRVLPRILAIIAMIPILVISLALAFYRVNNKPFIQMVESFFRYSMGSRLYIWRRKDVVNKTQQSALATKYLRLEVPKLGESKLKDLSWGLDVRKGEGEKDV
jgi:hypothetical protein